MKILLSSSHSYPAQQQIGAGLKPTPHPSSSAYSTFDLLAKGLVELGHEVSYFLQEGVLLSTEPDMEIVKEPVFDVDINHRMLDSKHLQYWKGVEWKKPFVISCHIHPKFANADWGTPDQSWIYPSRSLANSLGSERYVFNGVDPEEYIYSDLKENYFLFMASMEWDERKGLDTALLLSQKHHIPLVVLGGARTSERIEKVTNRCHEFKDVEYLGDIRGSEKAKLLAKAKCLIFPTQLEESFGLSMVEALISGTPVICSDKGACPEIITQDVGFVCKDQSDYDRAVELISDIEPYTCRNYVLDRFHYRKMAEHFVHQYQSEIHRES
ncbi:glycosyltransferase [Rhizobium paknamense]|uniref:Glycosyltransferase involved in cell wall biosynthesis n=1 Tax=Rhizobium paknamense TaxID=1206817 RepID=A0ABU0IJC3_9HYPH|nr:glycosyltransferase [Rhizobium paknamense]MDQ0458358.1 glycosyltransferase involved in cell wall biosynthesis [Rhizobium paknamense]